MIRAYAATFGANAAVFAVNTVGSILLARILGPTVLGEAALVTATYTTLVNLASLGLNVSSSTLIASDRAALDPLASHAMLIALALGAVPALAYLTLRGPLEATLFAATPPGLLLIGLATVPSGLFAAYWGALMVGLHEIALLNRLNLVGSIATSTVQVLVVVFIQADAYAVLATTLAGALGLNAAMLLILLRRHRWRPRFDRRLLRESLSLGLRSHVGNLANYVFIRLDFYVVSALAGPTALGYYALAKSLAEKLWLAVQPIYSVAFARIAGDDVEASTELTSRLTRAALWLLAALALGLALGATLFLAPIYTERFLPSLAPLYWLLPGTVLFGGSWFLGLFFTSRLRQPETNTAIAWASLVISIPLFAGLTSVAGIAGAAAASSLTYGLVFIATLIAYARATGRSPAQAALPQPEDRDRLVGYLRGVRLRLSGSA